MKFFEAVADTLATRGVETIFGVMGDANMAYLASYLREGRGRFVTAVHESGAVSMADGYHRGTGRVGVASVTHGPGFTNTLTALTEASRRRSQLVLLTGDAGSEPTYFQRFDVEGVTNSVGCLYARIESPESIERDIDRAMTLTTAHRLPVVLSVPFDLLRDDVGLTGRKPAAPAAPGLQQPEPEALDRALGMLASAERPVLLAGRGAVCANAKAELVQLAEILGAPLATTLLAKDFFSGHPLELGICGNLGHEQAITILSEADCIAAFGASLNMHTSARGDLFQSAKIIQIDHEPSAFNAYTRVDEAVNGDVRLVAATFVDQLTEAKIGPSAWAHRHQGALRQRREQDDFREIPHDRYVDVRAACLALNEALPKHRNVVSDTGRFTSAAWKYLHVDDPRRFTASGSFGSIGLGLATAIGFAAADTSVPTVATVGDGGFMMHASELNSAPRNGIPLIVVVFNDHCYGAEEHSLKTYGLDPRYSHLPWPSLADLGTALGMPAVTVRSVEDIELLRTTLHQPEASILLDVRLDPELDIRE